MHIEFTLDSWWCLFYHWRLPCLQWQSAKVRITISSLAGFKSISMGSSRHWRSTFSIFISNSHHRPHDQWFVNALNTTCLQINLSTLLLYWYIDWDISMIHYSEQMQWFLFFISLQVHWITVTSYERHRHGNNQQLECCFKTGFRVTINKTLNLCITVPL